MHNVNKTDQKPHAISSLSALTFKTFHRFTFVCIEITSNRVKSNEKDRTNLLQNSLLGACSMSNVLATKMLPSSVELGSMSTSGNSSITLQQQQHLSALLSAGTCCFKVTAPLNRLSMCLPFRLFRPSSFDHSTRSLSLFLALSLILLTNT